MEKTLKIKYVAPEVVDFKWMESLGLCNSNGSGDYSRCSNNGNNASDTNGFTVCLAVGNSAVGSGFVCSGGNSPSYV